MNDTLAVHQAGSDLPPLPSPAADVLAALRLQRELHPAVLARRSRARQGLDVRQDARRRLAEGGDAARALRLHVRAPRQEADVHGRASSARGASGTTTSSLDWHLLEQPLHAGLQQFVSDLNRVYAAEPALLRSATSSPRASRGSIATTATTRWCRCMRRAADPDDFVIARLQLHAGPARRLRVRRARAPGRYTEMLNSDAAIYGGSNVGNDGLVIDPPGRRTRLPDVPAADAACRSPA